MPQLTFCICPHVVGMPIKRRMSSTFCPDRRPRLHCAETERDMAEEGEGDGLLRGKGAEEKLKIVDKSHSCTRHMYRMYPSNGCPVDNECVCVAPDGNIQSVIWLNAIYCTSPVAQTYRIRNILSFCIRISPGNVRLSGASVSRAAYTGRHNIADTHTER